MALVDDETGHTGGLAYLRAVGGHAKVCVCRDPKVPKLLHIEPGHRLGQRQRTVLGSWVSHHENAAGRFDFVLLSGKTSTDQHRSPRRLVEGNPTDTVGGGSPVACTRTGLSLHGIFPGPRGHIGGVDADGVIVRQDGHGTGPQLAGADEGGDLSLDSHGVTRRYRHDRRLASAAQVWGHPTSPRHSSRTLRRPDDYYVPQIPGTESCNQRRLCIAAVEDTNFLRKAMDPVRRPGLPAYDDRNAFGSDPAQGSSQVVAGLGAGNEEERNAPMGGQG